MRLRPTVLLMMTLAARGASGQEAPALTTDRDRLSYALGMDLGGQLKARAVDIDPGVFASALKTALSGGRTLLTETEAKAVISDLQKAMVAKQVAAGRILSETNKREGEAFLAANGARPGVVVLPSGLQYEILEAGEGKKPTIDDTVVCHYRGTLVDGTEFDNSRGRPEPPALPVRGLVRGWGEALQLMPVGSKWRLVIPPDLAYGQRGAGATVGPNATILLEVELLAIR